ncbi:hypothetical protein PR003_g12474 [Phytophthora rubi]|uniref:Uncharacterized protein n=1 Tax=Phytophthora rubi TaxID=129364 RepID=A0A6A3L436_9STRA|nr:hypothetical protein PR001_g15156 [Phytophthora rubi]KAE9028482.1 hypothetical protein PR002_g10382 [Phytophthora rubi]KAE9336520.1 hypothetical protein PR003_g12474 [Phytophthora rubi]
MRQLQTWFVCFATFSACEWIARSHCFRSRHKVHLKTLAADHTIAWDSIGVEYGICTFGTSFLPTTTTGTCFYHKPRSPTKLECIARVVCRHSWPTWDTSRWRIVLSPARGSLALPSSSRTNR